MSKVLLLAVYADGMMDMYEELGICFISAYLRKFGHEVMLMAKKEEMCDYEKIIAFNPEFIGLPVYNVSKDAVYRAINNIRAELPGVYICVGGYLPTYKGKFMLEQNSQIDFAIYGEGEETFRELLLKIESNEPLREVYGLIYREGNDVIVNKPRKLIEDLETIPFPSRDLLADNKLNIAQLSSSRGCMSRCHFCASTLFWEKWRGKNSKSVVDEIEYIVNEYKINIFNFIDNSFEDSLGEYNRLYSIVKGIIGRELKINYFADFRAEFHRKANAEIMQLLKDSGLCGICLGVEAGNEEDLKLYGKIATIEDIEKAIELFRKYGINVEPGFINFNPYSNFTGLRKNIGFLERYGLASNNDYIVSTYKRYDGTYLSKKIQKDNLCGNELSEEGYLFINEDVGIFSKYIRNYSISINGCTKNALDKISFFSVKYHTLLNFIKRQCILNEKENSYNLVLEYEQKNREICANINNTVADWFRCLLDLAENKWDENQANLISDNLFNKEYIESNANSLEKCKVRLYKELMKDEIEILRIY